VTKQRFEDLRESRFGRCAYRETMPLNGEWCTFAGFHTDRLEGHADLITRAVLSILITKLDDARTDCWEGAFGACLVF